MGHELTEHDCSQASRVCHTALAKHDTTALDDVVQDCLLDLLALAKSWDKAVAPNFPPWAGAEMSRRARWRLIDTLRVEATIRRGEAGYYKRPAAPDPAKEAEVADLARLALQACVSGRQRTVVALLVEGYDQVSIAAKLGITTSAIAYHVTLARPLIAKAFASHAGYDERTLLRQG